MLSDKGFSSVAHVVNGQTQGRWALVWGALFMAAASGCYGARSGDDEGSAGAGGAGGASSGGSAGGGGLPDVGIPQLGSCTVPCEIVLAQGGELPGASASLSYDFATGSATVAAAGPLSVLGFTFETNQYGYSVWASGEWWFAFVLNEVYTNASYSLQQYNVMTAQMENPSTPGPPQKKRTSGA